VAEQLRPDLEEDLSRFVGDVAAVRIVAALKAVQNGAADTGARAARQLADYLAGERAWLASRGPFERFIAEVNELAQAAQRLTERAGRLR
jgi:ubiquinone biosynthesis protein UbiJ